MFSASLFLGFLVDEELEKKLSKANPALVAMFVDNQSEYLHRSSYKGKSYLGKKLEAPLEFSSVESLESHVESLMIRLVPTFSISDYPTQMIAQGSYVA